MSSTLKQLIREALALSSTDCIRLITRAPHSYKTYTIPKRNGGQRVIAQPARETKLVQRWLTEQYFNNLPIHSAATAYRARSSIKANAWAHAGNQYIAKFDFKDFFTSIKGTALTAHFARHFGDVLSVHDIEDMVRLSCISFRGGDDLCLSVGAPTSPLLSNTIMHDFDTRVMSRCAELGVTYTRYADDLAFSTNQKGVSSDIEPFLREIVRDLEYPRLRFNNQKTTLLSKQAQRRVTGLIINNDGQVSLGRERKRKISAMIHRFTLNALSEVDSYKLQGLLAFCLDVEPDFVARMKVKYGPPVLDSIFKLRVS